MVPRIKCTSERIKKTLGKRTPPTYRLSAQVASEQAQGFGWRVDRASLRGCLRQKVHHCAYEKTVGDRFTQGFPKTDIIEKDEHHKGGPGRSDLPSASNGRT
jgi:hypothetical protein